MLKVAVLIYHSDILKKYKYEWIIEFLKSLQKQTYFNYDIIELNYDKQNTDIFISNEVILNNKKIFLHKPFENHIQALNYLIKYVSKSHNCVINTNIDDIYDKNMIKTYVATYLKTKRNIISSQYNLIQDGIVQKIHNAYNTNDKDEQSIIFKNYIKNMNVKWFQLSGCFISLNIYKNKDLFIDYPLLEGFLFCKDHIDDIYVVDKVFVTHRIHEKQLSYKYR